MFLTKDKIKVNKDSIDFEILSMVNEKVIAFKFGGDRFENVSYFQDKLDDLKKQIDELKQSKRDLEKSSIDLETISDSMDLKIVKPNIDLDSSNLKPVESLKNETTSKIENQPVKTVDESGKKISMVQRVRNWIKDNGKIDFHPNEFLDFNKDFERNYFFKIISNMISEGILEQHSKGRLHVVSSMRDKL